MLAEAGCLWEGGAPEVNGWTAWGLKLEGMVCEDIFIFAAMVVLR